MDFWRNRTKLGKILIVIGAVLLALIVIAIAAPAPEDGQQAADAATRETATTAVETAKVVHDSDGYSCASDKTRFGRCPNNPYFGLTREQARAKKSAAAAQERAKAAREREAARRAREREARRQARLNAWKKGYTEFSDGLAYTWDNSVCDSSYWGCWGMRVVARDGCDSLYVERQTQDSAGTAVGWTNDTASHLAPGQVANLDFAITDDNVKTARLVEMNCY